MHFKISHNISDIHAFIIWLTFRRIVSFVIHKWCMCKKMYSWLYFVKFRQLWKGFDVNGDTFAVFHYRRDFAES